MTLKYHPIKARRLIIKLKWPETMENYHDISIIDSIMHFCT